MARDWLAERGYRSTLEYVRAVAIRVIEETGLLPHLNPGVMSYEEMARLKQVAPSMGMMLETSSDRLSERGGPHFGSPDKVPAVRLRVIEDAGRLAIPFTTGILVGIGETLAERAESLLAIRELHRRYRHVQEVIVQNFRAKPGTAMHDAPEPGDEEFLATVATARVVLGPRMHVQAPPNLSDPEQQPRLLDAGIDDWGGVSPLTPDHVNPERPWPAIEELDRRTAERGLELRERLTIYPEFALRPDPFLAGKMRAPVAAADGLGRPGRGDARGADRVAGPRGRLEAPVDRAHVREGRGRRPAGGRRGRLRRDRRARTHPGVARRTRAPAPARRRDPVGARQGRGAPAAHRRGGARAVPGGRGRPRGPVRGRRRAAARRGRRRRHLRREPQHQLHERLLRRVPVLRVRAARDRPGVLHAHARRGGRARPGGRRVGRAPRCACRAGSTPICRARSTSTCWTP